MNPTSSTCRCVKSKTLVQRATIFFRFCRQVLRLHTTIFKCYVKDTALIRQTFVYSANISSLGSMTAGILTGMKVIFLALGAMVLLFIANAFFGGSPLG